MAQEKSNKSSQNKTTKSTVSKSKKSTNSKTSKSSQINISKSVQKQVAKTAKKVAKKHPVLAVVLAIIFIGVVVAGYFAYQKYYAPVPVEAEGEISFHFMMLGNEYSGDSIYIKAGENDILIDAGSRAGSFNTIKGYVNQYCTDGKLEYVIATHADRDHIACFDKIFNEYTCQTIIDFGDRTNKTTEVYNTYVQSRDEEVENGATHYTALQCYNNENGAKRVYELADSITMEVLYNYFYEDHEGVTKSKIDENDFSVCLLFKHGDRKFLLTGDLEKEGEEKLAEKYPNLGQVELFKAGHHGSKTSSNDCLLSIIKPKVCVVSCNTGNDEFTSTNENMFPTQKFIDRISNYTDKVYVTTIADTRYTGGADFAPLNGNIIVSSTKEEGVKVNCTNNSTLLKDTAWFADNRTTPLAWSTNG